MKTKEKIGTIVMILSSVFMIFTAYMASFQSAKTAKKVATAIWYSLEDSSAIIQSWVCFGFLLIALLLIVVMLSSFVEQEGGALAIIYTLVLAMTLLLVTFNVKDVWKVLSDAFLAFPEFIGSIIKGIAKMIFCSPFIRWKESTCDIIAGVIQIILILIDIVIITIVVALPVGLIIDPDEKKSEARERSSKVSGLDIAAALIEATEETKRDIERKEMLDQLRDINRKL